MAVGVIEIVAGLLVAAKPRLGGMVEKGSVRWVASTLDLSFRLSDGQTTVPVRHTGTPPDLFGEGRGAETIDAQTPVVARLLFLDQRILTQHAQMAADRRA